MRKALRQRPWILAVTIIAAVTAWMATGQSGEDEAASAPRTIAQSRPRTPAAKVQVRTQQAEQVMRYVTVRGSTAPARRVELKAETAGRVVDVVAERGQRVRAGEVIVRLDDRDRHARIEEARATVQHWERNYQGQLELKTQGYVSDTHLAETLAALERARAELKRAELDLQYMIVRAPFDGTLQERLVEVGDFLQIGDPIAVFVEVDPLVVTGNVTETDVARIAVGDRGEARLATGDVVEGRIRYVSRVAETSTRTFRMELEAANPDSRLPAGVTAEIRIPVGEVWAQKISPALLTLDDEGNVGIKTVGPDGRVAFHSADISLSTSDGVWITGLPDEASVIVAGQGFVKPGDVVQAIPQDGQNTALAAGSER